MRTLALLLLLSTAFYAQADSENRHIQVSGDGWVTAVPDILTVTLTLQANGQDVEKLQMTVEKTAQQVTAAALEQGIAEGDIDSSRASVRPQYEWNDGKRIYRGQTVQRDISLTLRELDRYGALLQALSRLDIYSLGQPQPRHSRLAALRLDAIDAALADAEAKAERMAGTLDVKLGKVISALEQSASGGAMPPPRAMAMAMDSSAAPEVQFGKQRISATVLVRYAID